MPELVEEREAVATLILMFEWSAIVNHKRYEDRSEILGRQYIARLETKIGRLIDKYRSDKSQDSWYSLPELTEGVFVDALIEIGSIKLKDGKIEITSPALALCLVAAGAIYGGILNYKTAKESIIEIQKDIKIMLSEPASENFHLLESTCTPQDPDKIVQELHKVLIDENELDLIADRISSLKKPL